ncbi:dermonecrotic toxin domain-containing protein [Pseudomonas fildesensis]|uniref:Dermonecrotic toxin N-terminal domain-containing protein n=1 Tax=Pseudomonas fildesensis TaxID=1674920 RepID=A0A0J8G7N1_9PSED|nr:DUF6543 domain-containing protein [Pseudomonas fildesensis]KMT56889.1 hypothetical protein ACR52_04710 [Pseudomonas fildesensis]
MTSPPDHPHAPRPGNAAFDPFEPDVATEVESRAMCDPLIQRINAYTHPSRLINQIGLADWRCTESTQELARLIGRSPKVLKVIRAELRTAFEIDPDSLLFTEPESPGVPRKVDSLTDRALLLLVRPSVEINVNQFTALSVKGDPSRRLPYTPLDVLRRVIAMTLFERLARAVTDYWDTLAQGSWLTHRERWVELHKGLFADRAFLARQLGELTSAGMAMVQALIDAPTAQARQRAGGDWASVQVGQLMWPGTSAVAIPGALHLYREGDPSDAPHVIYLPGVVRNFYEAPSFSALQCTLLELNRSLFHDLWQCLPLSRRKELYRPADLSPATGFVCGLEVMDDALEQGAQALLTGQWSNELGCAVKVYFEHVFSETRPRPQPLDAASFLAHVEGARQQLVGSARLGVIGDQLLKWDQQRRSEEIIFASTASGLALRTAEWQIQRYEKGLVALLNPDDASAQTPAYQEVVSLVSQLKVQTQALNTLMQGAQPRLLNLDFWAERPGGVGTLRRGSLFMNAQTEALRCEVQLQHRLKLLSTAHRDLIIEVVDQPLATKRPGSQTQVLSIAVGSEPDAFYPLHNVWMVTTAAAVRVPARQLPVVLYAFGLDGGVMAFSGLDALTRSLKASLSSRDDSVLWGYVERDKRNDLRAHAVGETLAVRYVPLDGKPALASLKKLLGCCDRLHKSTEDITRIFSEVTDVELSRALLMVELEEQLKVPANSALSQAQANIELLRKVASQAKKLPAWLTGATRAQRKNFKRLQRLHLSNAYAFKSRLEQRLPDLNTFARRALIARLSEDGISPQFDIDQPLIDMPDDVRGSFCGWTSGCAVGDRNIVYTPTSVRTTFSLLELALHNLDPLAPWTQWRLDRAHYLQPDLKQQLNADYLIRMASSLDIGGQYDALINKVFYPRIDTHHMLSEGRIPELLNRKLQAGFAHHLFSAIQRGLSANALSLFNTAMAARTPQDLLKNQHELQLHVVHLVGHTMQHDRYIAGIVVVHDKPTGLCVVYWPDAPHALTLTEYNSLQRAQDELNRIGASPENVKALALQVAPGWAFEAITHHPDSVDRRGQVFNVRELSRHFFIAKGIWWGIGFVRSFRIKHLEPTASLDEIEEQTLEQIASDPKHWLAVVPTSHSNPQALLYRASVLDLQRRTQASSHSGEALQNYRIRRLSEQSDTRTRALVGFFYPVFGMFNDFYELLRMARSYHRFGDPHDALDVGFMAAFLVIDLLSNFIPGPKKAGRAAGGVTRPSPRAALRRIHHLRMTAHGGLSSVAPSPATQLKALERFKIKTVPEGAVALKGPGEKGVYVKNGELFVADDTHHYPVYRRSNEQSFRLKNKQTPGQDELILNIHQPREWLLGADAPQPVAGTSSGVLNPWRAPVPPPPDWRPPTVRAATENSIYQSPAQGTYWFDWRARVPNGQASGSSAIGTFHVHMEPPGFPYDTLYVGARYDTPTASGVGYYRLLPQGDNAPWSGIAFITKDEPLVSLARVDVERWTSTALGEQPIPVSRHPAGEWVLHRPLFDRPLEQSVGRAFPTMTTHSQKMAAARLIEMADSSRSVTATHLLNSRATLDNWLVQTPSGVGQTDDLLRMLRPTERVGGYINIGFDGKAPGFTRVDFQVAGLDPALRSRGRQVATQQNVAQHLAIKRVLEQQGFNVQELQVMRGHYPMLELVATHPLSNSNRLYYLSLQWLGSGSTQLRTKLTDKWFKTAINKYPDSLPLAGVKRAMEQQRLVRIMAGIQWPTKGTVQPSVYFVKLNPS